MTVPPAYGGGGGGASDFISLTDVDPSAYGAGDAAKAIIVNAAKDGLEFGGLGSALAWTAFTMTVEGVTTNPTKGTVTFDTAAFVVDGNLMHITYGYAQSAAGVDGSGEYLFKMPAGFTIDTTLLAVATGSGGNIVGHGRATSDAASNVELNVYARNTTEFLVQFDSQFLDHAQIYAFGHVGAVTLGFNITVPVLPV